MVRFALVIRRRNSTLCYISRLSSGTKAFVPFEDFSGKRLRPEIERCGLSLWGLLRFGWRFSGTCRKGWLPEGAVCRFHSLRTRTW